jgi:predicted RND superfamily exporter protein
MSANYRQRIEKGFAAFGSLVYRNHWKTLFMILALVAVLFSQLPKLTMDTSTEGFLHESDPTLIAYNKFREQFGRDELVLVTIKTDDVFDPVFLQKLQKLHWELADNVPYLDDITSLINARDTRGSEGELLVEDLLENWPQNQEQIEAIRQRAMANPVYRNLMLSTDGTITTVVLKNDAFAGPQSTDDALGGFDDGAQEEEPQQDIDRTLLSDAQNSEVVNIINDITRNYVDDNFEIHLAGSPVVTDVLKKAMETNMKKFMLMALGTISLVLFVLFRRISGVVLPMLTVLLSLLSTLGLMAILGIAFKLPTQILPSFLLAVGVGASVHLLSVFFRRLQKLNDGEEISEHFPALYPGAQPRSAIDTAA